MKNFIRPLFVAFIISVLLHFIFFDTMNRTLVKEHLKINTSDKKTDKKKGYTSIKYVKLQQPKIIEIPQPTPKPGFSLKIQIPVIV